jgi:hypothetical protein
MLLLLTSKDVNGTQIIHLKLKINAYYGKNKMRKPY